MKRMHQVQAFAILVIAAMVVGLAGCSGPSKPARQPPRTLMSKQLRLVHRVGGTHDRGVVHEGVWYQTFGHSLLVIAPGEVTPVKTIELGPRGETGPAVDMMVDDRSDPPRLLAVVEDDALVEFTLEMPQSPMVVNRWDDARLGIRPRRLSRIGDEIYVSGPGGVVRVSDLNHVFAHAEDVGRVAMSDAGLIACVGRSVIDLRDQRYLASATEVQMLDADHSIRDAAMLFVRQGEQNALVGLMTSDVRELSGQQGTVAITGTVHSVRVIDDRLWIVSDLAIAGYRLTPQGLEDPKYLDVVGARDVARLDAGRLAIAGTFGRLVYDLTSVASAADPENERRFVKVHREPSRLSRAITDGRYILAGSHEGLWMYLINSRVDLTTRRFEAPPPQPSRSATLAGARAQIRDDGLAISISATDAAPSPAMPIVYSDPHGARLRCVAAIDGQFWIGHDRGITVLAAPTFADEGEGRKRTKRRSGAAADLNAAVEGQLRLAGPVLYIYPLLVGGGASFVSEFGGFGVAKFVDEPIGQR